MTTAATTIPSVADSSRCDVYLTLIPRGLHHVALSIIRRELADFEVVKLELIDEPVEDEDEAEYCRYLKGLMQKKSNKKQSKGTYNQNAPLGSVFDKEHLKKDVSVGYRRDDAMEDDIASTGTSCIWTMSGIWEGSVFVKLETNAPASAIRSISILGPLLACVHLWRLNDASKLDGTLEEAATIVRELVQRKESGYTIDTAMNIWRQHACEWPKDYQLPSGKSLRYRVSCIRSHSKAFPYRRDDFLKAVVDDIVLSGGDTNEWKVNLKDYDVEVVILVLSPACLAIGLTLRPYQLHHASNFQGNTLPPDTSLPYLSSQLISGITRLRPTNVHLMLELADIQVGDMVLDPCAGIGTIPLHNTKGIGLGGDLCLEPDGDGGPQERAASLEYMHQFGHSHQSTNLCAWDAGSLPIRSSSIDVVVSDLPFGKRCLSSAKLNSFLPLWVGELARVVRPKGRIVLLCGAYGIVVDGLQDINGTGQNNNWIVTAVFPVNIGGLLAWIVMAKRTITPVIAVKNHQSRLRKLTGNRDRDNKQLRVLNETKGGKKRKSSGSV